MVPHSGSVLVDQTRAESPWVVAWATARNAAITDDLLVKEFDNNKTAFRGLEFFCAALGLNDNPTLLAAHKDSAAECGVSLFEFLRRGYALRREAEEDGIL